MTDETTTHARATARDILRVIPLVMRTVAAELRAAGELPAPAHFGLLSLLAAHPTPQTLTELATRQGVSLPTMSNSISALVARGWVRRSVGEEDRRQTRIEVTAKGRSALQRVGRSAEAHLAELLAQLDDETQTSLQASLQVLLEVFRHAPVCQPAAQRAEGKGDAVRRRRSRRQPPADTPAAQ